MHKCILCFMGKFAAERMPSLADEVAMWVSSGPGKVLVLLDADTGAWDKGHDLDLATRWMQVWQTD